MDIQLFLNKKGIIHGGDSKRIRCEKSGVLKIGTAEITVTAGEHCIMPLLFYGASGIYDATFGTKDGTYVLEKVMLRNGRILPPSDTAVSLMEFHCRADAAEKERAEIREKLEELSNIFDTNSLNFLIK